MPVRLRLALISVSPLLSSSVIFTWMSVDSVCGKRTKVVPSVSLVIMVLAPPRLPTPLPTICEVTLMVPVGVPHPASSLSFAKV